MEYLNIKSLNRFAWFNDYSFEHKGYTIKPINGCYLNGYFIGNVQMTLDESEQRMIVYMPEHQDVLE